MTRDRKSTGRVTFVGAGPGDPGLLAVHGVEALRAAGLVYTDAGVNPAILELTTAEVRLAELTAALQAFCGRTGLGPAVQISAEKLQTLADFWPLCGFIFDGPADDPPARERWLGAEGLAALAAARDALAATEAFDVPSIEAALTAVVERLGCKPRDVYQPLRVALAGRPVSPGIFETVAVLGRETTLARIDVALNL